MTWAAKLTSKSKQSAVEVDYSMHEAEAKAHYNAACTPQGPEWSLLGEGVRGLWLHKMHLKNAGHPEWWRHNAS